MGGFVSLVSYIPITYKGTSTRDYQQYRLENRQWRWKGSNIRDRQGLSRINPIIMHKTFKRQCCWSSKEQPWYKRYRMDRHNKQNSWSMWYSQSRRHLWIGLCKQATCKLDSRPPLDQQQLWIHQSRFQTGIGLEAQPIPSLVKSLHDIVKSPFRRLEKNPFGTGNYELFGYFKRYAITHQICFSKMSKRKKLGTKDFH